MLINIAKPTLSEKMLNSTHLTDKVEFTAQRHDVLGSIKILIMKSFIRWNIQIETSMWKIQRMSFMLAGAHRYDNVFARGYQGYSI